MTRRTSPQATFATEADLAAVVIKWLTSDGWECFQEVEHCDVADIVATRGDELAVVECKLHLNLHLLHQADRWRNRATYTWAAAPKSRSARDADGWNFAQVACRAIGIGLLEVSPPRVYSITTDVHVRVPPAPQAKDTSLLRAVLRPEHQTYAAAGSPTGHRWTPFRETERNLAAFVKENPGVLLREALVSVPHHWKSRSPPTATARKLIDRGVMGGVRVEGTGRNIRLYPV